MGGRMKRYLLPLVYFGGLLIFIEYYLAYRWKEYGTAIVMAIGIAGFAIQYFRQKSRR
jgi:hypothetical protein